MTYVVTCGGGCGLRDQLESGLRLTLTSDLCVALGLELWLRRDQLGSEFQLRGVTSLVMVDLGVRDDL